MYQDQWSSRARDFYERLDAKTQARVDRAVQEICKSPLTSSNVKPLHGDYKGCFRKRIGSYRLIYTLDHSKNTLSVLVLDDRKDIYK
jgi:mRNA interferase RelE/StbE